MHLAARRQLPKSSAVLTIRRPAETGLTYHVQASTNLTGWADIANYSGTNFVLTAQAVEVSRTGSPNEVVTIRDALAIISPAKRFLRVLITKP